MQLSSEVLEEICKEEEFELYHSPSFGLPHLQRLMQYADFCFTQKADYASMGACLYALDHYLPTRNKQKMALLRQAYNRLCSLSNSEDEYVWEMSSQLSDNYRHFFEPAD